MTNTSIDKAEFIVNRILDKLENEIFDISKGKINIEVSIGVSCIVCSEFKNDDIPHPVPNTYFENLSEKLINASDEMLYKAKKDPNSSVHCHKEIK